MQFSPVKTITTKILSCILLGFSFTFLLHHPLFSQYQIKHITTENGLPSNGIKGMELDEATGFLWIATEAGLVRYNGMSFTTFDLSTNPELGANRIVLAVKNINGKIFAAAEKGALVTVKDNRFETYLTGENIAQYNYNYFLAISASDTLFRQCYKTPWPDYFHFLSTSIVPLNDTSCAVLSTWGLYYYSISTTLPVPIVNAPSGIKSIFKLGNTLFYETKEGGIFSIDINRGTASKILVTDIQGDKISFNQNNSHIFWQVGMENPIVVQNQTASVLELKANNHIQIKQIASGLPKNTFFTCIQYKKKGDYLFLGSASKGIYILHKNQLVAKSPATADIDQKNAFYSQIELPDGNIMTSDGTIIGDAKPHDNFNIRPGFAKTTYSINDSVQIFYQADSVYSYNRKTYRKKFLFTTHINEVFALAYSGADLYFADQKGIAIVRDTNLTFIKDFDEKKAVHLFPSNMLQIAPGKLALATCEGLIRFDIHTRETDTLLKLPSICIRELYQEGDYLLIGTYGGGYYVMKNGRLKAMPLDVNQYLKYAHCFIKDDNGFCWISTNKGLFKTKMSDILEAYEKDSPQIYYHYLGKDDGMESIEFNGGCKPCALRLKNRNFSFPTMDGMLWFNPNEVNTELPAGSVYIDKMIVDEKTENIQVNNLLELKENAKKIDFTITFNASCKKENLYLSYRLNNDKWLPVQMIADEAKITLFNLSYGKYTLTIRKMNGFGIDNFSYSSLSFIIPPPFYHQWWFRILAVPVLLGIGYLIFKWLLRQSASRERKLQLMVDEKTADLNEKNIQLEKNNRIKMRLISIINHDIMTPLKFMSYAGNALVENQDSINRRQQIETISQMTKTAKDMEQLSAQILNWIIYHDSEHRMQKEEFDLHQLVEMIISVLGFSANQRNTKLKNLVPEYFFVTLYLEPVRVMLYNLILNSLNFTRDGEVKVECKQQDNLLYLTVSDTGLGMNQEQVDNLMHNEKVIASINVDNKKGTGIGYLIIKDLLRLMGGSLDIQSKKNSGTTVVVSLPEG